MVLTNTTLLYPNGPNKTLRFVIPLSLRYRYPTLDIGYILIWEECENKYTELY